jgi:YidC/Oxa1 family membrane protein insertase
MDLQRLFLFLIFAISLVLVWDGWQRYQHPEQQIQQSVTTNNELPKPQPALPAGSGQAALSGTGLATIAQQPVQHTTGKSINVKTDILEAEISTIGGDISRLALLKHPDSLDKNKPLVLFNRGKGTHNYFAQSGLIGTGLPNHNSLFVSE